MVFYTIVQHNIWHFKILENVCTYIIHVVFGKICISNIFIYLLNDIKYANLNNFVTFIAIKYRLYNSLKYYTFKFVSNVRFFYNIIKYFKTQ